MNKNLAKLNYVIPEHEEAQGRKQEHSCPPNCSPKFILKILDMNLFFTTAYYKVNSKFEKILKNNFNDSSYIKVTAFEDMLVRYAHYSESLFV